MADGDTSVDGLLREFLLETRDNLDAVEAYGTALSEAPADAVVQKRLLELVHAVKGACGFLPLPRLEAVAAAVAEAADTLTEDGQMPSSAAMETILTAVGRMRDILDAVDRDGEEPPGATADAELLAALVAITREGSPVADGADDADSVDEGEGLAEADFAAAALLNIAAEEGPSRFYVVFRSGVDGPMAIDAAQVAWLDLLEEDVAGGVAMVRGEALPLCDVDGGRIGGLVGTKPVIVISDGERHVGLVVDEVVDVTTDPDGRAGSPVTVIEAERFLGS